jgi:hypothetical protein
MKNVLTLFVFAFFFLYACKKETLHQHNYSSPKEIEPYVIRFEFEAQKRGYNINIHTTDIKIKYGDPVGLSVADCYMNLNIIIVDSLIWNTNGGDLERERVIFHELGHGYLNRLHLNDTMPNGEYKSMMLGGFSPMPLVNKFNYCDTSTLTNRHCYYLDELFNSSIEIPIWANG